MIIDSGIQGEDAGWYRRLPIAGTTITPGKKFIAFRAKISSTYVSKEPFQAENSYASPRYTGHRKLASCITITFKVSEIAIVGSYARNEQKPDSDIDILVDFSEPIGWEVVDLKEYLE
jgi:hypothetical protein